MTTERAHLTRFAWLSIAAAILTICLKAVAYFVTGSVGLLSDALESIVNLVAAIAALVALTLVAKGPDEEHAYGHDKVEYFSSTLEGALVLVAAGAIVLTALPRLMDPQPIAQVGIGVGVSVVASLVNLLVARQLLRAGKEHRSFTLEADARHLITDVWTSAGVVIAVIGVTVTGWERLDPLIALVVAANIVWTGVTLLRRSFLGLLDTALPAEDLATINTILERYQELDDIHTHALRTREAGSRRFVSFHILVPGWWSVHEGHRLLEEIEEEIIEALPGVTVFTHLEALDDPASYADTTLDRNREREPVHSG
ncbi:MAG: cation diffusion facilitator family transporter [Chloroflexota bacterium]|nr:cation diffusion facilitator family transporter [Chloroflexota bacterium]